jgi:hypothetical protein
MKLPSAPGVIGGWAAIGSAGAYDACPGVGHGNLLPPLCQNKFCRHQSSILYIKVYRMAGR